jgi:hypothetical protein
MASISSFDAAFFSEATRSLAFAASSRFFAALLFLGIVLASHGANCSCALGTLLCGLGMSNHYLAHLRLARVRCNENIARLESMLALQRSRREAIEAAIHDMEPGVQAAGAEHCPRAI